VSSFGISGTNAHVILEQAPTPAGHTDAPPTEPAPGVLPWVLSAASPAALAETADRMRSVAGEPGALAWSLWRTRATLAHRAVILGTDRAEFDTALEALADGLPAANLVVGSVGGDRGGVVFVFPGQGSQWEGMG
ncbi:ketoacyl-synthetase C-terminal extension domain-containing protein, partial [Streptomyces sp. SID3343]|uniref:ketoacyl-synthetase C-terminal extension domain-containing protein n=1 Tax=Streptomyces sp. SID3343 TaxID=2690260 RepID=UPI0013C0A7A0